MMHAFTEKEFMAFVEAASRAPSVHNTQPWLFLRRYDAIEVYADPSRRLPVLDPQGRAMHISLGAAILNLRIAMAANGLLPRTELLPDPDTPRHVATVHAADTRRVALEDRELHVAVGQRHTSRAPFDDFVPPQRDLSALEAAARTEGAVLTLADSAESSALLGLAWVAEMRALEDPAYRDELRRWTTDDPYRDDGVPLDAVGPRPALGAVPVRDFAVDRDVPGRETVRFERHPTVAILSTYGDGTQDWLRAGQALQRVLLEATVRGLTTSLITQPLEDPGLRSVLQNPERLTNVQVLLRIGYGPAGPATPRRPLDEIIVPSHPVPMRPPHLG